MKKSNYPIWIPSLQKELYFKEVDSDQHRRILKIINDLRDNEFSDLLNEIIKENIEDDKFYKNLTVLDRFIIILYSRMYSFGDKIRLEKTCQKCGGKHVIQIELPKIIDSLTPYIDRKFNKTLYIDDCYTIEADLPNIRHSDTIKKGFSNISQHIDVNQNRFYSSFIKNIKIHDKIFESLSLRLDEMTEVMNCLPSAVADNLYKNFIKDITNLFSELVIVDAACPTTSCAEKYQVSMRLDDLNTVCRILFSDDNLETFFMNIYNLSSAAHIPPNFLLNLSPLEVSMFTNFLRQENKQRHKNAGHDKNLFEGPSEFS